MNMCTRVTERCLGLLTTVRPGEGKSVGLFFGYAFLLLTCYYILKTVREPLLLADGSAEQKSYAYAVIALVLLVLVPLYGAACRRVPKRRLVRRVSLFFMAGLMLLYALGRGGVDVGFAYYVWVGVFGVTMLAQFWAHAAHTFKTESGQRLFPIIMAGACFGALAGPPLGSALHLKLGAWNAIAVAIVLLAVTLPLVEWTWRSVPAVSRNDNRPADSKTGRLFGGFELVARDRYLRLLALAAVLLNCVNTLGEYILTTLVVEHAARLEAQQPGVDAGDVIAAFYANYYLTVNAVSAALQICVVARIFRWIGVQGALLVLPIVASIGYGLVVFVPIIGVIRAVKIIENVADYSIMNTARQVLYLPLPARQQFEGKTAVDTFFWRFGDVAQAGIVFAGSCWLGFGFRQFAMLNIALALVWIVLAVRIGRRYPIRPARRIRIDWRAAAAGAVTATFAVAAFTLPAPAAAEPRALFAGHEPLAIELSMDMGALCRADRRRTCEEAPATLAYTGADGTRHSLEVSVKARGKWRNTGGHCSLPPLFVHFRGDTAGTVFEGEQMLPLTTHCREKPSRFEQYVLREYLAYRIYNLLTDASLRVRLARVTYTDTGRRGRSSERYAFFTEHFESLASRLGGELWQTAAFRPQQSDPRTLATFDLFQYLIGNTDFSALKGHNVAYVRESSGRVVTVPYDFDFSGLVDAHYAGPPPQLPIRSVTQRLFRGFCQPELDWPALFEHFQSRRVGIEDVVTAMPGLTASSRAEVSAFVADFHDVIGSPKHRQREVIDACRSPESQARRRPRRRPTGRGPRGRARPASPGTHLEPQRFRSAAARSDCCAARRAEARSAASPACRSARSVSPAAARCP
ncbi:MAG: MFS transporter [Gammaproteobacteria bacterium]|nr:MFS transporter [Gammaproteobacteria bacterium]